MQDANPWVDGEISGQFNGVESGVDWEISGKFNGVERIII